MLHLLYREASRIHTYRKTHIVESISIADLGFVLVQSASIGRTAKFPDYSLET